MIAFTLKKNRQAEWAANEHTQHYAKQGRREVVPKAYKKLIGACRMSQDPVVREALKEYECGLAFTDMLEGKTNEGTNE